MITRRHFLLQLGAAGVVLATAPRALAADLVIVLNAKNTSTPNASFAKQLFVGDALFWPGNVPVRPVVRPADLPAGERFFKAIGMTPSRFKRLWQEKQLSGQGVMPETIALSAAVIARVAGDVGAIGVALPEEVPSNTPGVRVVAFG